MSAERNVTREQAQARADRIRVFRDELAAAESDGAVRLTADQRETLDRYHDTLLASLTARFDVDRSAAQHHLSLGLRVVSLLGAVALTAAAILFFQRIWGFVPSAGQVAIVWAAPLAALWAAQRTSRAERTLYFTALLAVLAFGCFVLDVYVLGSVLNARESPLPLFVWSAFALAVAYAWNLRLLLVGGAVCAIAFCAAVTVTWSQLPWDLFFVRPESLLIPAAAVAATSVAPFNAQRGLFPATLRGVGFGIIALTVVVLSSFGEASRLWLPPRTIEHIYQVAGFAYALLLIGFGVRRGWTETINIGAALFGLLLFLRFVDWWWDWMPKYLFFATVGAAALAFMFVLRAVRRSAAGPHE